MRVIVCGGRDYTKGVWEALDALAELEDDWCTLAHGDATGADTAAGNWGLAYGLDVHPYPANWTKYGKAAGPKRNRHMAKHFKPDLVVAFPGGRGTADMVRVARERGVPVWFPFGEP